MAASPQQHSASLEGRAIRVLFVEDDHDYREIVGDKLSGHGFAVRGFGDGTSLLDSLDTADDADLILLDWGLPKTSGIDLLSQLRRHGVNLPVVFLTGQTLPADESLAFDKGALDFIDKARGVDVLVRRLKCVVEAAKPAADPRPDKLMVCGRLVLRPDISRVYWDEADVGLTVGEYNIVQLLASNVGRYVTYRALYDCMHYAGFIGGYGDHGYWANVRSAVKRIRIKFHERDPSFAEIENYAGLGYGWARPGGTSRELADDDGLTADLRAAGRVRVAAPIPAPSLSAGTRLRRRR